MNSKKKYDFNANNIEELISLRVSNSELTKEINPFILGYLNTKVIDYLNSTPDDYRKENPINLPNKSWRDSTLNDIKSLCNQLYHGSGFEEKHPISNISVASIYKMMEMFHFDFEKRNTNYQLKQDIMTFKHSMGLGEITLFILFEK